MNRTAIQTFINRMKEPPKKGYEFKNLNTATPEVYIYDEIGAWGITALDFIDELKQINSANFDLHISSPGGEVWDGLAIYNAIKQHPANVTVYIDGIAASAASFIAMAGDNIVIAKNAEMMIHDAMGLVMGNASDMQEMITHLNRMSDNIASIYADKAGGTPEEWRAKMLAETWFTATEALDAGLVNSVQGSEPVGDSNSVMTSLFKRNSNSLAPTGDEEIDFQIDPDVIRRAFEGKL